MKISEVERLTGLTAKAIRLYEEKGLISVTRKENSYRDYTKEDVDKLNFIRSLREIGVTISQIYLHFNNVITFEEMIDNRRREMERENTVYSENFNKFVENLETFKENSININVVNNENTLLGLDIGTTNISAVIVDQENNEVLETYTIPNNSKLETENDFAENDVNWVTDKCMRIIDSLLLAYPNTKGIGLTGQMHGFVYVSENGKAVSPLYNWQDGRGNRIFQREKTYCQEIFDRTGHNCNSGYAFSTMFYNDVNNLEPCNAKSFCTIMDYVVMILTDRKTPLIHISNAASFGLCDIKNNSFYKEAVEKLNLTHITLPEIANSSNIAGYYKNIPVTVAIGDNQASFFGSVKDEKTTALVNIGTGSQVSVVTTELTCVPDVLEIRPYLFNKYLISGSALCGGRAYAILEKFFSDYVYASSGNKISQYEIMDTLALEAYTGGSPLCVSTLFCGTRQNPGQRGYVSHIDDKNFTPGNLISGVLCGMANELKSYFDGIEHETITHIVASGNAVKRNTVLKKILENTFDMPLTLTSNDEEAAIGSALFAGASI